MISNPVGFSLCPGIKREDGYVFAAEEGRCAVARHFTEGDTAFAELVYTVDGREITNRIAVNSTGVELDAEESGEIAFALPAFCFDGERETEIICKDNALSVVYDGWVCRYTVTDGEITDLGYTVASRNGFYRAFAAIGKKKINIKIEIFGQ